MLGGVGKGGRGGEGEEEGLWGGGVEIEVKWAHTHTLAPSHAVLVFVSVLSLLS
jgi:hypothetical protein